MEYIDLKLDQIKVCLIRYCEYKNCLSSAEKIYTNNMNKMKAKEYSFSRSFLRYFLSDLFNEDPLNIKISTPPGKKPILLEKYGFISLSHTVDALAICWSPYEVGVDLERFDRNTISRGMFERLFNKEEKKNFDKLNIENSNQFIKMWVIKEAISKYSNIHILEALKCWQWDIGSHIAINNKAKNRARVFQYRIQDWELGIASDFLEKLDPIICIQ